MSTFKKLEAKLKEIPDSDFAVGLARKSAATREQLADLEKKVGVKVPKELAALLSTWGALRVDAKTEVWPRVKELEVAPAWRFWHGFTVLGVGEGLPPAFTVASALSKGMLKAKLLPFVVRQGAKWVGVVGSQGVGTCLPDGTEFEPFKGDAIDFILAEVASLEELIDKQRTKSTGTDELMEQGRKAKWKGPKASDVVDALKERPTEELAPHLEELCKALLPPGQLSMGCLDVIAAAGAKGFERVAKLVYAHFERKDAPYVLELLGKVGDVSPRALELYVEGLESDDDDTRSYAVKAIAQVKATALLPKIEKRYGGDFDDADARFEVLGLLGALGSKRFAQFVSESLQHVEDDDGFTSLVGALEGQKVASPIAKALLTRAKEIEAGTPNQFNAVESLLNAGVKDRAFMEPIAVAFEARKGLWAPRAKALLERL